MIVFVIGHFLFLLTFKKSQVIGSARALSALRSGKPLMILDGPTKAGVPVILRLRANAWFWIIICVNSDDPACSISCSELSVRAVRILEILPSSSRVSVLMKDL